MVASAVEASGLVSGSRGGVQQLEQDPLHNDQRILLQSHPDPHAATCPHIGSEERSRRLVAAVGTAVVGIYIHKELVHGGM